MGEVRFRGLCWQESSRSDSLVNLISFVNKKLRDKICLNYQIVLNLLTRLQNFVIIFVSGHVTAHGTAHILFN